MPSRTTPMTADQRRERGRIAALLRHRPDDPQLAEARRTLRAERLESHVRVVLDQDPPLTPDERRRIAAVLLPDAGGGA